MGGRRGRDRKANYVGGEGRGRDRKPDFVTCTTQFVRDGWKHIFILPCLENASLGDGSGCQTG